MFLGISRLRISSAVESTLVTHSGEICVDVYGPDTCGIKVCTLLVSIWSKWSFTILHGEWISWSVFVSSSSVSSWSLITNFVRCIFNGFDFNFFLKKFLTYPPSYSSIEAHHPYALELPNPSIFTFMPGYPVSFFFHNSFETSASSCNSYWTRYWILIEAW